MHQTVANMLKRASLKMGQSKHTNCSMINSIMSGIPPFLCTSVACSPKSRILFKSLPSSEYEVGLYGLLVLKRSPKIMHTYDQELALADSAHISTLDHSEVSMKQFLMLTFFQV